MTDSRLLTAEELDRITDSYYGCEDAAATDIQALLGDIQALTESLRLIRDPYYLSSVRGDLLLARIGAEAERAIYRKRAIT